MPPRQGDLFAAQPWGQAEAAALEPELPLLQHQLTAWQGRLAQHQAPLFAASTLSSSDQQGVLLSVEQLSVGQEGLAELAQRFDPLALQPQPLSFWRWPNPVLRGAALYVVLDRPAGLEHPLVLYIGETGRAEQRWKGEHDCKDYLAAYGEALQKANLTSRLSIGFWGDVPSQTRPRRTLETALIRRWLPAFNKETRGRWATPFTATVG